MTLPKDQDPVHYARVRVSDDMLTSFARIAQSGTTGEALDNDGAALLLSLAGPIAIELQQRRAAMSTARDLFDLDNVLFMPGS